MLKSKFAILKISLCTFMAAFLLLLQIAAVHGSAITNMLPLSSSIDPPDSLKSPQCCAPVFLAPISISGNNVYVSWWERANKISNEPILRISNDSGKTFGPVMHLAIDGK